MAMSIGFYSCISFEGKENIILVKNDTEKEIFLLSFFDNRIKNDLPICLMPRAQVELFSDSRTSGIDIVFSFDEIVYKINTGYADDYWRYTIQFLKSDTSVFGIEAHFIAKGVTRTDLRQLEILVNEE